MWPKCATRRDGLEPAIPCHELLNPSKVPAPQTANRHFLRVLHVFFAGIFLDPSAESVGNNGLYAWGLPRAPRFPKA